MTTICIVGGGNLAHVCAGFLGAQKGVKIRILTRQPEKWTGGGGGVEVMDAMNRRFRAVPERIPSTPQEAVMGAYIVLFCLPGFAIREMLERIKPYVTSSILVGTVISSTGFFFQAFDVLPHDIPLFGFQRVPFISRIVEYGKSAKLLGYKSSHRIAVENTDSKGVIAKNLETLFQGPFEVLENHLAVSLSNSNPLLHTARLYTMFKDGDVLYPYNPLFYAEWTDEASEVLIRMDAELQSLLDRLGLPIGSIPPILEYYGCQDTFSLTRKIRSIPAFQEISSPMIQDVNAYRIDFKSRYFAEDFLYGLRFIHDLVIQRSIDAPTIINVYKWGIKLLKGKM